VIGNDDFLPTLSIGDQFGVEGTGGTRPMTFTVSLSAPSAVPVSFDVLTHDGDARAGSDFIGVSQRLTIPAGSTSLDFNVDIIGDNMLEPMESFTVEIFNPTDATIADGTASARIANDDAAYPQLLIDDVSVSEGNAGTRLATFNLHLSAASAYPVSFDIATSNGSALAGSDYVASALAGQVIPAGATTASFSVTVNGDNAIEADETFKATLSNVVNAYGEGVQATATILNDDVPPSLSIADVSVAEGNSGTRLATFTVQLSAPAPAPVNFTIATADGTALAGSDYVARSQSVQIDTGASSATFAVTINGDTAIEPNETFLVNVNLIGGATVADGQAVGTISNDDVLPSLSIADASIAEGNSGSQNISFTVSLSAAATGTVTFDIATANGTAMAPGDYTARSATAQTIPAGTLSKTFTVNVKGDKSLEPNETFLVNLSKVSGPVTLADGQAIGTIVNDDAAKFSVSRVSTGGLVDDVVVGAAVHSVRAVPRDELSRARSAIDGWRQQRPVPLHVHLSEQPAENEACAAFYGLTPTGVLHSEGLLGPETTVVHATHLTADDVATLGATGTTACFCPTTERDLADGIGPARELVDASAALALGSDQHAVVDMFEEARGLEAHERLRTLQRGRFSPDQLVAAMTSRGHSSLGRPHAGRLAVGAPADLVAVRLDSPRTAGSLAAQVVHSATAADVHRVVVGGRTIVSDGEHVLGDVGALLRDAIEPLWEGR